MMVCDWTESESDLIVKVRKMMKRMDITAENDLLKRTEKSKGTLSLGEKHCDTVSENDSDLIVKVRRMMN